MSKQVPAVTTQVTLQKMLEALGRAFILVFGYTPTRDVISVLLAQWALETGNGARMICFNPGNARWFPGNASDYCTFMTWEMVAGKRVNASGNFRAFPTLEQGCADYLGMLHTRFLRAWPAVEKGDPVLFAHALKQLRYYTADEATYAAGLKARFGTFMKLPQAQWEIDAAAAQAAPTQPELAASERTTFAPVVGIVTDPPENDSEPPPPRAA